MLSFTFWVGVMSWMLEDIYMRFSGCNICDLYRLCKKSHPQVSIGHMYSVCITACLNVCETYQ